MPDLEDLIRDILAEEPSPPEQEAEEQTTNEWGWARLGTEDAGRLVIDDGTRWDTTVATVTTLHDQNGRSMTIEELIDRALVTETLTNRIETLTTNEAHQYLEGKVHHLERLVEELRARLQYLEWKDRTQS